jgi:hypothetical protein
MDNMEEDEVAGFIRRTSRGETPAPEDHLMDRTSHVLHRSARSSMRPEFRLPWDELTTTGDIPAAQSGNASARSAGTSYNTMGRDARQDVSGVPSPRRAFVSARDFAEDSSSVSSYGGHGQPTGQGWGAYQRMDAPRRPTQEQPATGRNFFGSRSNNTRPEPEGQSPTTTRQSRQQQPAPAHNAQQGWSNPFSPSARRSTYSLSESSRAALNNPDSVVESIGTQRLMPSRDPTAAFYSPPRPRFATPYTEPASSINWTVPRNEEQYQRGRARHGPRNPSEANPRRSGFKFVDDAELKRWEEHKAIDDLTKQRNEDRAKGLMPAPGPRRPWVKPSFPAPSNESKQLMSPSMRRQCDVWGKAYSAQQAKQRLEAQAAKRKRDDEEGGLRKRSRTRRSRSRSP